MTHEHEGNGNESYEDDLEDKLGTFLEEEEQLYKHYEDLYMKRKDREIPIKSNENGN